MGIEKLPPAPASGSWWTEHRGVVIAVVVLLLVGGVTVMIIVLLHHKKDPTTPSGGGGSESGGTSDHKPIPVQKCVYKLSGVDSSFNWKSDDLRQSCVDAICGGKVSEVMAMTNVGTKVTTEHAILDASASTMASKCAPSKPDATTKASLSCRQVLHLYPKQFTCPSGSSVIIPPDPVCEYTWSNDTTSTPHPTITDQASFDRCVASRCAPMDSQTFAVGSLATLQIGVPGKTGDSECDPKLHRTLTTKITCAEAPLYFEKQFSATCDACDDSYYDWKSGKVGDLDPKTFHPTNYLVLSQCRQSKCAGSSDLDKQMVGSVSRPHTATKIASAPSWCPATKIKTMVGPMSCAEAWALPNPPFLACDQSLKCTLTDTSMNVTQFTRSNVFADVVIKNVRSTIGPFLVTAKRAALDEATCGPGSVVFLVTGGKGGAKARTYCVSAFSEMGNTGALAVLPRDDDLAAYVLGGDPTGLQTFYEDTVAMSVVSHEIKQNPTKTTDDLTRYKGTIVSIGWEDVDGQEGYNAPINAMRVCSLATIVSSGPNATTTATLPKSTDGNRFQCDRLLINNLVKAAMLNGDVTNLYLALPMIGT